MNKSETSILVVIEYDKDEFEYGIQTSSHLDTHKKQVSPLDKQLLPILELIMSDNKITGIAVAAESLGGFVSSRLILISLNIIAWQKDIPIEIVSKFELSDETTRNKRLAALSSKKKFTEQVLPEYHRPPDISSSKRKSKFTIK